MMNKKGKAFTTALLVILTLFVIGGVSFGIYTGVKETTIDDVEKTPEQEVKEISGIKASNLRVITKDIQDAGKVQVVVPVTCWEEKDSKTLIIDATSSSSTAFTSLAGFNTGDTAVCRAFNNNTYYGGVLDGKDLKTQSKLMATPTETLNLEVHRIIRQPPEITLTDGNTDTIVSSGDFGQPIVSQANLTLGGAGTDKFDEVKVKFNETNSTFWLESVIVDVPASSEIENVFISNMEDKSNINIKHFKDRQNFRFSPKGGAMFLRADDEYSLGSLTVKSSTDVPNEDIDVYIIDQQHFKSVDGSIKLGVENDLEVKEDIGAGDNLISFQFSVL